MLKFILMLSVVSLISCQPIAAACGEASSAVDESAASTPVAASYVSAGGSAMPATASGVKRKLRLVYSRGTAAATEAAVLHAQSSGSCLRGPALGVLAGDVGGGASSPSDEVSSAKRFAADDAVGGAGSTPSVDALIKGCLKPSAFAARATTGKAEAYSLEAKSSSACASSAAIEWTGPLADLVEAQKDYRNLERFFLEGKKREVIVMRGRTGATAGRILFLYSQNVPLGDKWAHHIASDAKFSDLMVIALDNAGIDCGGASALAAMPNLLRLSLQNNPLLNGTPIKKSIMEKFPAGFDDRSNDKGCCLDDIGDR